MSSAAATKVEPDALVPRWADAFNARDLDGMLVCMAEDVEFYPLRLSGLGGPYRGHDGMRDWFVRLERLRNDHQIVVSQARVLDDGRVLAIGSLSIAEEAGFAPFCGLHRIDHGPIAAAHHYMTDPEMIEHLGLAP